MTNETSTVSDSFSERENDRVTEDDVVVRTPNGVRYESHLINATGLPTELVEEIEGRNASSSDE